MRIVSQDRKVSINFDNCAVCIAGKYIVASKDMMSAPSRIATIGQYESEERAKEVFEDIHKAYAPVYTMSSGMTDEQVREMVVQSKSTASRHITCMPRDSYITVFDNYVYYMPEK